MKIHFNEVTKRVTGYTTMGEAPAGSLDLGEGITFDFIHDLDEYEVQNEVVTHIGASAEKIAEIELQRVTSITNEATRIIEAVYSPLKQRKLMSTVIALKDKRDDLGVVLNAEEEAMLQTIRDMNSWISAIRMIENTAIANGTALESIVWNA